MLKELCLHFGTIIIAIVAVLEWLGGDLPGRWALAVCLLATLYILADLSFVAASAARADTGAQSR